MSHPAEGSVTQVSGPAATTGRTSSSSSSAAPPVAADDSTTTVVKVTEWSVDLKLPSKFNGKDWQTWRAEMTYVFKGRRLWEIVNGTQPEPISDDRAIVKYRDSANVAKCLLGAALDYSLKVFIGDDSDVTTAWARLVARFKPVTQAAGMTRLTEFYSAKVKDGESLHDYFSRLQLLASKLSQAPSMETLIWRILEGLPDSYETIIPTLRLQTEIADVQAALLTHEIFLKGKEESSNSTASMATALYTNSALPRPNFNSNRTPGNEQHCDHQNHRPKNQAQRRNYDQRRVKRPQNRTTEGQGAAKDNRCSYCHSFGHSISACNKLKRDLDTDAAGKELLPKHYLNITIDCDDAKSSRPLPHEWILDSGATTHMTCQREWLRDYIPLTDHQVQLGDGSYIHAEGIGTIRGDYVFPQGGRHSVELPHTLYIPSLTKNLISTHELVARDYTITMDKHRTIIREPNNRLVFRAVPRGGLLIVHLKIEIPPAIDGMFIAERVPIMKDYDDLHRCLGHIGVTKIKGAIRDNPALGGSGGQIKLSPCDVCAQAKQRRAPIGDGPIKRASKPMELIHSDVCGPFPTETFSKKRYFVSFIDDYTRFSWIYLLRMKDEVAGMLDNFLTYATAHGRPCLLRSDNGGEYVGEPLQKVLRQHGVRHVPSEPYTPQHNGVAERFNQSIGSMIRAMLIDSGLSRPYWGEAAMTANYVLNRTATVANEGRSPFELLTGEKPKLSHVQIFGSPAFVYVHAEKRNKLDNRGVKVIYLGPCEHSSASRFIIPGRRNIIITRSAEFRTPTPTVKIEPVSNINKEGSVDVLHADSVSDDDQENPYEIHDYIDMEDNPTADMEMETDADTEPFDLIDQADEPRSMDADESELIEPAHSHAPALATTPKPRRIAKRTNRGASLATTPREIAIQPVSAPAMPRSRGTIDPTPARRSECERTPNPLIFNNQHLTFLTTDQLGTDHDTPESYKEAIQCPDAEHWKRAMIDEHKALLNNKTWTLVPRPRNCKPVRAKWVYKVKLRADGSIECYKARWVAKGYSQRFGIDYDETFAPVMRMENLRFLLAIATILDLEIHQMDVDLAFLQASLMEKIYIEQPEGFVDANHPEWVCLLLQSLYGLKQAPFEWNQLLDKHLRSCGYISLDADPCIYIKVKAEVLIIIAIYVDDCVIIAPHNEIEAAKCTLSSRFKMKDLGPAKSILSLEILRQRQQGKLQIRQRGHIEALIKTVHLEHAAVKHTPLPTGIQLECIKKTPSNCYNLPYRRVIGNLLYIALASRPDIAFAASYLSRFASGYNQTHWNAALHVVRYLAAMKEHAITYSRHLAFYIKGRLQAPVGFCDADWGGDHNNRKSVSGIMFFFAGGPISWMSKSQSTVAVSSTEAEYMAISEAVKHALYLHQLRAPLHLDTSLPIKLNVDNQSAITVANSPQNSFNARMKHLDIRVHHLRDTIASGTVTLAYRPTSDMIADMLTKPLPSPRLSHLKGLANLSGVSHK